MATSERRDDDVGPLVVLRGLIVRALHLGVAVPDVEELWTGDERQGREATEIVLWSSAMTGKNIAYPTSASPMGAQ